MGFDNSNNKSDSPANNFSSDDMISFGNFIRDNFYVNGSPMLLTLNPSKYPNANIDEIFIYWCIENGK